jgi:hypothetical protein
MWQEAETSTHQDHVIKHVVGATVLGWIVAGEAAHLLLDIGFLWSIYLDGEMNLLPQGVALAEFEADEISALDRSELVFDADLLLSNGLQATGLKCFVGAPGECLIENVEMLTLNTRRRIAIRGELAHIHIDLNPDTAEVQVFFRDASH